MFHFQDDSYNFSQNRDAVICSECAWLELALLPYLTMALVASRYRAIVKPLELQTSDALLKTCCKAGCVWIVSMVFAIPEAVFSDLYSFSNPEKNVTFEACAPYPVSEKILQEVHSLVCFSCSTLCHWLLFLSIIFLSPELYTKVHSTCQQKNTVMPVSR